MRHETPRSGRGHGRVGDPGSDLPAGPRPLGFSGFERRTHHARGPVDGPGVRSFERGGIKFAILGLLKEKPRHGYDIIREMEERSGGFYSPSPGAVYPTLQALEDGDLVTSASEEGKKVYSLTEAGLAYAEEHKERARRHHDRWEARWGSGPRGENREVMGGIRDILGEIRRAVRAVAGDPAALQQIDAALNEALVKIRDLTSGNGSRTKTNPAGQAADAQPAGRRSSEDRPRWRVDVDRAAGRDGGALADGGPRPDGHVRPDDSVVPAATPTRNQPPLRPGRWRAAPLLVGVVRPTRYSNNGG